MKAIVLNDDTDPAARKLGADPRRYCVKHLVLLLAMLLCACSDGTLTTQQTPQAITDGSAEANADAAQDSGIDIDAGPKPWRFVSMPDFLNFDLGPEDSHLPDTNAQHQDMAAYVLDQVAAENPDFVLAAGDQVMGHWHEDEDNVQAFGPVNTTGEQRLAIEAASAHYYPAWFERFADRGLDVVTTIGDHEIGDNPFPLNLTPAYKYWWTQHFGPPQHVFVHRNVAVLTVDPFLQFTQGDDVKLRLSGVGVAWLDGNLRRYCDDPSIDHVIVQSHLPILGCARKQHSSGLKVVWAWKSRFWQSLINSCARVYLAGEVHDWDLKMEDGLMQITHGGLLGYAPDHNYLVADVYPDRIDFTIKEAELAYPQGTSNKLWQTGNNRPAAYYEVGDYETVQTLTLPGATAPGCQ